MPVEYVVTLLTGNGRPVNRGILFSLASFCTIIFTVLPLILAIAGELGWALLSLVAALSMGGVMWQADQLDQVGTALEHAYPARNHFGALCEALEWPDRRVRSIAALILTRALPTLTAAEGDQLTRERRNFLYRCLSPRTARLNPALTIAILRALPVFGAEGALPYVVRLAKSRAFTRSGLQIRREAQCALPALEERVAAQRAAEAARAAAEAEVFAIGEAAIGDSEREQRAAMAARVDTQVKEFEEERRKVRRPDMRFGFLLAAWAITPLAAMKAFEYFSNGDWPVGLLFGALVLAATQLHRVTVTDRHKAIAKQLSGMDDVRFIGISSSLLEWPDEDVRSLALGALTPLLHQVKASDKALLTLDQRAGLYRMLTLSHANQHVEFLVAALKALEQIGDAAAIPCVEQF